MNRQDATTIQRAADMAMLDSLRCTARARDCVDAYQVLIERSKALIQDSEFRCRVAETTIRAHRLPML